MKGLLTISFLFLLSPVFAQEDAAALAKQLTSSSTTDLQKVTAIFRWITDNISYKPRYSGRVAVIGAHSLKFSQSEFVIDDSPLKPLNERIADAVLSSKEAVCDGYARLFNVLCTYAGIRSEIIVGYARSTQNKPTEKFGVNHYWNAVMIDSDWHLLDVTWASGYMSSKKNEFVRDYDENYFLAAPAIFIQDHYPDDVRWTLLPDTKIPEEFRLSPFKQKSFAKYRITSFYPSTGVIEAAVGDTIRLQLETSVAENARNISPDVLVDSTIFSYSPSSIFLRPGEAEIATENNHHNYLYKVTSPDVEWLYLLYNDDMVLRYKINVKKKRS